MTAHLGETRHSSRYCNANFQMGEACGDGKAEAICALAKNVVRDVIEIGHRLCEVRERHEGQFLAWIEQERSQRTAYNFIRAYEASNVWAVEALRQYAAKTALFAY
jgi:Protein of unknown function (DUF3102)